MKTLILLLALLTLSSCKTTYNYIVITPEKETKKTDIKPNPIPDRWNYVDIKRLERVSDSIVKSIRNIHDNIN